MNLFELAAKITLDSSEYERGLAGATQGMKKVAAGVAKAATAVYGVASATIGVLGKQAIAAYGDYEQLVGGVDTLFKNSSAKVQKYAANAYKTAGLSANQYMETVTSFSASLLQSLAGDTDKAADVADMALRDMSDNANKMGTAMESIQMAYQGFAKQNYTMLDNLKLGYGGTKTEMERLLKDAQKLSGVKYDISNLSDVYEAIHVIQTELGITGTTAKEAATTIQGSWAAVKASWQNLLVGVADGTQDFGTLINNFVDSAGTLVENLMPRIKDSLTGVAKLFKRLAPIAIDAIVDAAPDLITAGGDMIVALINGISKNIPRLVAAARKVGRALIDNISKVLPDILKGVKSLWQEMGSVTKAIIAAIVAVKAFKVAVEVFTAVKAAAQAMSGPIGWVSLAIGALAAAAIVLVSVFDSATASMHKYTEAEQDILFAGEAARESLADAAKAHYNNLEAIDAETKRTQDLWEELKTLVDENGNVIGANHERVDFITGELNKALGLELERNGDIVESYKDIQNEISNTIRKKRVMALYESYGDLAREAEEQRTAVLQEVMVQDGAFKDTVESNAATIKSAYENLDAIYQRYSQYGVFKSYGLNESGNIEYAVDEDALRGLLGSAILNPLAKKTIETQLNIFLEQAFVYNDAVAAIQTASQNLDAAQFAAREIFATISNYNKASELITLAEYETDTEVVKQYFDEVESLIDSDISYRWEAAKERGYIIESQRAEMAKDVKYAAWYAKFYRENVEAGFKGFDAVGLAEARGKADELLDLWSTLPDEAKATGENIGQGLADGLGAKASAVQRAAEAVGAIISDTLNSYFEIKSPSKVTRRIGHYIDEGLMLGMSDKLGEISASAERVAEYAMPTIGTINAGGYGGTSYGSNSTSIGTIVLNVDGAHVQNVERLADLVADRINNDVLRRVAAT